MTMGNSKVELHGSFTSAALQAFLIPKKTKSQQHDHSALKNQYVIAATHVAERTGWVGRLWSGVACWLSAAPLTSRHGVC